MLGAWRCVLGLMVYPDELRRGGRVTRDWTLAFTPYIRQDAPITENIPVK